MPKLTPAKTRLLGDLKTEIMNAMDEMASLSGQVRALYKKAKDGGLDQQAIRTVIRRGRKDRTQLALFDATVLDYESALGIQAALPLTSVERAEQALEAADKAVQDDPDFDEVDIVDEGELNNGDDAIDVRPTFLKNKGDVKAEPGFKDKNEHMSAGQVRDYFDKTGT